MSCNGACARHTCRRCSAEGACRSGLAAATQRATCCTNTLALRRWYSLCTCRRSSASASTSTQSCACTRPPAHWELWLQHEPRFARHVPMSRVPIPSKRPVSVRSLNYAARHERVTGRQCERFANRLSLSLWHTWQYASTRFWSRRSCSPPAPQPPRPVLPLPLGTRVAPLPFLPMLRQNDGAAVCVERYAARQTCLSVFHYKHSLNTERY